MCDVGRQKEARFLGQTHVRNGAIYRGIWSVLVSFETMVDDSWNGGCRSSWLQAIACFIATIVPDTAATPEPESNSIGIHVIARSTC